MPALADDLVIDRDDRADDGVRVGPPSPVASELDRALKQLEIGLRAGLHVHSEAYGGDSALRAMCRLNCAPVPRHAAAGAAVELVDPDERAGARVGGRVVVEGPVEVEADVRTPARERRRLEDDPPSGGERAVVADGLW